MNETDLLGLWENLSGEAHQPSGMERRRVLPDAALDLFACVFWPSGQSGLLIEARGSFRVQNERLPACRGLRFFHESFQGIEPRETLGIVLEDQSLKEVFAVLGSDLMTAAGSAGSAEAGMLRCLDRIAMWQGLLEQLPATGLGEEAQRGLFGELLVLQRVHLQAVDPLAAATSWNGPRRAYQDFETNGAAIEVKTSLAKRHARLTITSEKQLDERPLRALFLAHVALSEATAGVSLVDLVGRLRALFAEDHAALNEFNLRLMSSGYLDPHAGLYATTYEVDRLRLFHVSGAFPRLTGADVPPGVGDLTYTIIADDLAPFETDVPAVVANIGGVNG